MHYLRACGRAIFVFWEAQKGQGGLCSFWFCVGHTSESWETQCFGSGQGLGILRVVLVSVPALLWNWPGHHPSGQVSINPNRRSDRCKNPNRGSGMSKNTLRLPPGVHACGVPGPVHSTLEGGTVMLQTAHSSGKEHA